MNNLIIRALSFAAHKHRDQRRKDVEASPYINHPIDVMTILAIEGGIDDADVLAAAILHDTLEDTETTPEELTRAFGKKISDIVVELTDDQSAPRPARYQEQLDKAPHYSEEAKLVRLADKIANTRDATRSPPPMWSIDRLAGHFAQSYNVVEILRGKTHSGLESIFYNAFEATKPLIRK